MRDEKRLLKIAKKMAKLEKRLDYEDNDAVQEIQAEMEELASSLTPEELFEVDNLIVEKHLL